MSTSDISKLIREYEFRFKKRFGQNFLRDPRMLSRIVDAAELKEGDYVMEIGPGLGGLTLILAERCQEVLAIEIDRDLVSILREQALPRNIRLVEGDALKLEWRCLLTENGWNEQPVKLVANLPYYLTTPLIMKALEEDTPFERLVVMVQLEVAQRMLASPGTKDYGVLSLAVQYYSDPELVAKVPRSSFIPAPNVDSAVVNLKIRKPQVSAPIKPLFQVIRATFGQRRKTIKNGLKPLIKSWGIDASQLETALAKAGISAKDRGETLSLAQFSALTEALLVHANESR